MRSRSGLYVPGCAARPEIIIDGILKCFEKPETLEEPVAVEDPAKDEQEKIEEKPEDVTEEEQDDEEQNRNIRKFRLIPFDRSM